MAVAAGFATPGDVGFEQDVRHTQEITRHAPNGRWVPNIFMMGENDVIGMSPAKENRETFRSTTNRPEKAIASGHYNILSPSGAQEILGRRGVIPASFLHGQRSVSTESERRCLLQIKRNALMKGGPISPGRVFIVDTNRRFSGWPLFVVRHPEMIQELGNQWTMTRAEISFLMQIRYTRFGETGLRRKGA